jgi:hypothetical protein
MYLKLELSNAITCSDYLVHPIRKVITAFVAYAHMYVCMYRVFEAQADWTWREFLRKSY